jgi:hypothetical protein
VFVPKRYFELCRLFRVFKVELIQATNSIMIHSAILTRIIADTNALAYSETEHPGVQKKVFIRLATGVKKVDY